MLFLVFRFPTAISAFRIPALAEIAFPRDILGTEGLAFPRDILGTEGLAVSRNCLEQFHMELLISSKWIWFRTMSHLELYSWKRLEWFQIEVNKAQRKVIGTLLLLFYRFPTHLLSSCLLHSFRASVSWKREAYLYQLVRFQM